MPDVAREVAEDAARRAGALLRERAGAVRSIQYKQGPTDLVTEMDRQAEALVIRAVRDAFPDDTILSEEAGHLPGRSARRWIIDPLDGTTNYAHGVPIYAVSIGLEEDGRPILGVVYDPCRDECFVAARGGGATVNGEPIAVSSTGALDTAVVATGFAYTIRQGRDTNLPEHGAVALRCRAVREIGSAALSLASVAAGRFDGFWELRLGPWDVAAGRLLIEEAGGCVTNLTGGPLDPTEPAIVASNGRIHAEIIEALRGASAGVTAAHPDTPRRSP